MSKPTLSYALEYACKGFHVLPVHHPENGACSCGEAECRSVGKHPRISQWQTKASTDPAVIKGWWAKWPKANVGIQTGVQSNLLVVDVDIKEGSKKHLKEVRDTYPELNNTSIVRTGGGGFHFYLRSADEELVNSASKLIKNVDIRANGGFIVAPPSQHESKKSYDWEIGLEALKDLPSKLAADLRKPKAKPPKTSGLSEGSRNTTMYSIAGQLRSEGLDKDQILKKLSDLNKTECSPPLEQSELESICGSIMKYEPRDKSLKIYEKLTNTDFEQAKVLYEQNKSRILFDIDRSMYLIYNGKHWIEDQNQHHIEKLAGKLQPYYKEQADIEADPEIKKSLLNSALSCSSLARIRSIATMLHIAIPDIQIRTDVLNTNGELLNFMNGTLNLATQKLQKHNPDDHITAVLAYNFDTEAQSPIWVKFINTMFNHDERLVNFVQQALGYSLSTDQSQECFFYLYGNGKNGKSTLVEVLQSLLGEYSIKAGFTCIMQKKYGDGIPNDIARFTGKRLVVLSETPRGSQLDEAKVKDLTGGDTISARFMRQEHFDFTPHHTIWMYGNYKPMIVGTDDGIWRRIVLINCSHAVSEKERDPLLKKKLKNELPGILNWCIEGYKSYLKNGRKFDVPDSVHNALLEYRSSSDITSKFILDVCEHSPTSSEKFSDIFDVYEHWCDNLGRPPESKRVLATNLRNNRFVDMKSGGHLYFKGISIADEYKTE